MEFTMELVEIQLSAGRHVLHEHPMTATSWTLPCVRKILQKPGILTVDAHMCAFGLQSTDSLGTSLVKKPTKFMTSAPLIAEALGRKCTNITQPPHLQHRHVHLMNGRAAIH